MKIISTNPSKGYKKLGSVAVSSKVEVQKKVALARAAALSWKEIGLDARIKHMRALINVFAKHKKEYSLLMSREMGMPLAQMEDDYDGGIAFLNWYCDNASKALAPEVTYETTSEQHTAVREPRGVTAVIVPWNFPFTNFVWQCGQNLIAGNTVVFKHSEETPLSGKAIEKAFVEAGFPKGVFNEVYGGRDVGKLLVRQDVDAICFTGSTKAGRDVYAIGAKKMIPVHMELGGSSPGIVFEDADIDAAIASIYDFRFGCSGQMCKALKRLMVHESKFDEVVEKLAAHIATKKVGDAEDRTTDIGPVVAERQVVLLEAQVKDALRKGARAIVGGARTAGLKGAYYEPTLLVDVKKNMRVWQEEVFGPVLPIVPFKSEEEALWLANDTVYGLGAYVYTNDAKRFERMASRIESGMVSQNETNFIRACNPFGGYKQSGLGREHGIHGFHDVTQVKLIVRQK